MNNPSQSGQPRLSAQPEIDRDTLASEYFSLLPYEPYPVQEEAMLAYFAGDPGLGDQGVLICAPTGTGKTMIAEAAVYEALRTGKRMYYTTPLIALTDQKMDELQASAVRWGFPADSVGLVTGNRRVNGDAPVLVVVAEILLNRLLNPEVFDFGEVTSVVMDEFHSFNDPERGIVWELTLALLPAHVRTMLLSATVGNAYEFTSWLSRAHNRRLQLVTGDERKVPLQYEWVEDEILNDFAERIARGDDVERRTPSLVFCFSRSQCWTVAEMLKGKSLIDKSRQSELADYLNSADLSTGAGPKLKQILMRGVGVHHAGVMPRYRRMVEELFERKLLAMCVCTETLAAGINLPARSVVLPSLMKGPKDKKRLVDTASAQQIFGRAGRPQYDDRGYVYALAHEDDVKLHKWREKFDSIPEDTKDPGLLKAKKQLKKKMPKRRAGETYWTEQQFVSLQQAKSADLVSRGHLPWRLLAYMLGKSPSIQPLRDLVGRRLMTPKKTEEAQRGLNQMLVTLWQAGYVVPSPLPEVKGESNTKPGVSKKTQADSKKQDELQPEPTGGLFGDLLDQMRSDEPAAESPASENAEQVETDESDGSKEQVSVKSYDLENYQPVEAKPTEKLDRLVHLRSINPIYGVYMADLIASADDNERIATLESVLEVPGTVARYTRMPKLEDMPPGKLATEYLDAELLTRGIATAEELGASSGEDDEEIRDRGFGRVMFDEPKVWPLTIGEKVHRLFQNDFPRIDNVRIRPVWIVGELLNYDLDFNKYITTKKLQKEEGILLRHCLRMILFLDEMANVPPESTTVETWEDWMDDLADKLTIACQKADPQTTNEILAEDNGDDDLVASGRR
ncbi:DEAD/DEAH box helicase [Stieleria sp. JC731]|uniref:DEAD/DEAH box helicase n=1 Tax=Pirellulaceae TaxID=2691357 RepID=UPI001E57E750|nr:DEAD/DEAH box helicase [Stieleria sp. JC731]MCC9603273.1 DEAD/DEAH box helicase [Stieleria sp. JC731]